MIYTHKSGKVEDSTGCMAKHWIYAWNEHKSMPTHTHTCPHLFPVSFFLIVENPPAGLYVPISISPSERVKTYFFLSGPKLKNPRKGHISITWIRNPYLYRKAGDDKNTVPA